LLHFKEKTKSEKAMSADEMIFFHPLAVNGLMLKLTNNATTEFGLVLLLLLF